MPLMPSYKRDQRTGSWMVRWSVIDPSTGKRSQPSKRPFRTRQEAVDWYERNVAGKRTSTSSTMPLSQYLDQWLDSHGAGLSDSARKSYGQAIKNASSHLGRIRLRELEPSHVRDWHAAMVRRGYKPNTIRVYHAVLAAALNRAEDDNIIYRAPTRRAGPRLSKDRTERPHWTADQIEYFLEATDLGVDEPNWQAVPYRIMALSAIRPGECRSLRWSDVDIGRGTLSVPDSKTPTGVRTFAIPGQLVDDLRLWRPAQNQARLTAPSWEDNDLIVTSGKYSGRKMSDNALARRLRHYCNELDLPSITPHGLRHSWTSWMAAMGVHPSIAQQVLGHANIGETLGTYTHASEAMSRQAATAVDDALNASGVSSVHPRRIR